MNKKIMLLALTAISGAILALPSMASANFSHLDATDSFTVASAITGHMTRADGNNVSCTSTSGSGSLETTTTGTVTLIFHGCKNNLGFNCTGTGQPTGTISVRATFHLIWLPASGGMPATPGILLTPHHGEPIPTPGKGRFAVFSCFGVTVDVFGNGVIGTITSPNCGVKSKTATLSFGSASAGTQTDLTWTGANYDLESKIGTGEHKTSSIDAHATITFNGERTLTCTTA